MFLKKFVFFLFFCFSNYFLKNIKDTDRHTIADVLNNFFANIGKDFACAIPNVEMSPLDFLKTPSSNSFIISPTTVEEIETKSYWSF